MNLILSRRSYTCEIEGELCSSTDNPGNTDTTHFVENDGHYEIVQGKALRQVGIVEVEEEHCQGEYHVLPGQLSVGVAQYPQSDHCCHQSCPTKRVESSAGITYARICMVVIYTRHTEVHRAHIGTQGILYICRYTEHTVYT